MCRLALRERVGYVFRVWGPVLLGENDIAVLVE